MGKLEKKINKLNEILKQAEIVAWMGKISEKTITITFDENNKIFSKDFEFTNRNDYSKFNKEIRMRYYGIE